MVIISRAAAPSSSSLLIPAVRSCFDRPSLVRYAETPANPQTSLCSASPALPRSDQKPPADLRVFFTLHQDTARRSAVRRRSLQPDVHKVTKSAAAESSAQAFLPHQHSLVSGVLVGVGITPSTTVTSGRAGLRPELFKTVWMLTSGMQSCVNREAGM